MLRNEKIGSFHTLLKLTKQGIKAKLIVYRFAANTTLIILQIVLISICRSDK